ncbi:unnamed protein product [Darwinula stevensoni]|uniref:Helicase ATP-binding domain-containing protein n=1 Tax=Darwinula stevensoni TaxID=69355 RepID=A0A7R9A7Q8_9CRUS|nr:unnamed protein product [Darwinula stevensoni]CAG0893031.1 unnamed protein product [Darwinula stevensoni]
MLAGIVVQPVGLLKNVAFDSSPKFWLLEPGSLASLKQEESKPMPLFMSDIQRLLLLTQMGICCPYPPRWCRLLRQSKISHTVCCVIEGTTLNEMQVQDKGGILDALFQDRVSFVAPARYGSGVPQELCHIPVSSTKLNKLVKEYGSVEDAVKNGEVCQMYKALFPIDSLIKRDSVATPNDSKKFHRMLLLLSPYEMVVENFPIPLGSEWSDYTMTQDRYDEVTPDSPLYAVDCEMCLTMDQKHELTRIAVVNEALKVVYHSFVKPANRIINYLTEYSGITAEMLANVNTTLEEVQRDLKALLPKDAILIGHSLNSDLHALKMFHPYVIDTSVILNTTGLPNRKDKLSTLAQIFLGKTIQSEETGHNPIEDATVTMRLCLLKLKHGLQFGDVCQGWVPGTGAEDIFNGAPVKDLNESFFHYLCYDSRKSASLVGKESAISCYEEMLKGYRASQNVHLLPKACNKHVANYVYDHTRDFSLLVSHFVVSDSKSGDARAKDLERMVRRLRKIHTNAAPSAFFIVIISGTDTEDGACLVGIKQAVVVAAVVVVAPAIGVIRRGTWPGTAQMVTVAVVGVVVATVEAILEGLDKTVEALQKEPAKSGYAIDQERNEHEVLGEGTSETGLTEDKERSHPIGNNFRLGIIAGNNVTAAPALPPRQVEQVPMAVAREGSGPPRMRTSALPRFALSPSLSLLSVRHSLHRLGCAFQLGSLATKQHSTHHNSESKEDLPEMPIENLSETISPGIKFEEYEIPVKVRGNNPPVPIETFQTLFNQETLLGNMRRANYKVPTPFQKYAIPIVMSGRDLMACSQTGSGAITACVLPILHKLLADGINEVAFNDQPEPYVLILSHTLEMATKVYKECLAMSEGAFHQPLVSFLGSGASQTKKIENGCYILVATPESLLDFVDRGIVSFKKVKSLVLMEANQMIPDKINIMSEVRKIVSHPTMPKEGERQTLIFAARFPIEAQSSFQLLLSNYIFLAAGMVGLFYRDIRKDYPFETRRNKLMEILDECGCCCRNGKDAMSRRRLCPHYGAFFLLQDSMSSPIESSKMLHPMHLLLSLSEMYRDKFPIPRTSEWCDYKVTCNKYCKVKQESPLFAIDCEFVGTDVNDEELAHIAVINQDLEIVYKTLVKPLHPIVDYRTEKSGITAEMLSNVDMTLEEVQRDLKALLPNDAILVGHSLCYDFHVLKVKLTFTIINKIFHPYVIDTSVIFHISQKKKDSLAELAQYFFGEEIQKNEEGHNPQEDATVAMRLCLLKLEKGLEFGNNLADRLPLRRTRE